MTQRRRRPQRRLSCRVSRPDLAPRCSAVSGCPEASASSSRPRRRAAGCSRASAPLPAGRSQTGTSRPCARKLPTYLVPAPSDRPADRRQARHRVQQRLLVLGQHPPQVLAVAHPAPVRTADRAQRRRRHDGGVGPLHGGGELTARVGRVLHPVVEPFPHAHLERGVVEQVLQPWPGPGQARGDDGAAPLGREDVEQRPREVAADVAGAARHLQPQVGPGRRPGPSLPRTAAGPSTTSPAARPGPAGAAARSRPARSRAAPPSRSHRPCPGTDAPRTRRPRSCRGRPCTACPSRKDTARAGRRRAPRRRLPVGQSVGLHRSGGHVSGGGC